MHNDNGEQRTTFLAILVWSLALMGAITLTGLLAEKGVGLLRDYIYSVNHNLDSQQQNQ